ncbi:S41 family peptidase [Chitinophaga sp. HK235]|uniref:S41 family peptidase n=1 Tax=Chitinophaga sp. HK235 TaxID=2952571 RepID=UPI001BA82B68|nr:S41 family peptidase [Chitinophaga sp. HK235]
MIRLPALLILLLANVFFVLSLASGQDNGFQPDRVFPVKALQEDLQYLRYKLETTHPNLYQYTPRKNFVIFMDSLHNAIQQPMTERTFYGLITLLNGKVKDGHTMELLSEATRMYHNRNSLFFPFHVFVSGNRLFVQIPCLKDTSLARGTEIISINSQPVATIVQQLLDRQIRDGNNLQYAQWVISNYFKEYYSFLFGYPTTFILQYKEKDGGIGTAAIGALPKDSIQFYKSINDLQSAVSKKGRGIIYEKWPLAHTALLAIKTFNVDLLESLYEQNFDSTIHAIFSTIQHDQVEHLVLDLRDNQGGDFAPGKLLLSYLIKKPVHYLSGSKEALWILPASHCFKGKLYVLINGGSFSNAAIVSAYLQQSQRAAFIGEETGGNRTQISGDAEEYILPNTKIVCYIASHSYQINPSKNDGHGVQPDHIVIPQREDIIIGRDPAKAFVQEMIKKQGSHEGF